MEFSGCRLEAWKPSKTSEVEFRVQRFRVSGLGFRSRFWGLGIKDWNLGIRVRGLLPPSHLDAFQ